MYIYELPFEINKELCRLLDHDNDWKELAGNFMKYSAFDVNEIEQTTRRQFSSPTDLLFRKWGQLNHRVEELFVLLHRMKHVPALRILLPVVDREINEQKTQKVEDSDQLLPVPVVLIKKGVQQKNQNPVQLHSPTDDSNSDTSNNSNSMSDRTEELKDEILRNASAIPMLSYKDLKEATNNWSPKNLLGRGGFGQVFKGEWKLLPVAVKRLRDNDGKNRELIREMCLNQYRHDNILPLYGYSLGGPEACLVYQLMAGGSLEQRLRIKPGQKPLTWPQRYRIAHGVARGLQYLHTMEVTPLIHGDIKPANILLDQCTMPKIGDFGLARKGDDSAYLKVSRVNGTRPYLPGDYVSSRNLSPAVDVFSYGVVMAEVATALPCVDRARAAPALSEYIHHLARHGMMDFASLEDKALIGTLNSNPRLCNEFVSIGIHCTKYRGEERPTMLDIYKRLDAMEFPGKHFT
ncbi:unnamed protein product, partial [Brenthis ino]